jgi:hypothetical protein
VYTLYGSVTLDLFSKLFICLWTVDLMLQIWLLALLLRIRFLKRLYYRTKYVDRKLSVRPITNPAAASTMKDNRIGLKSGDFSARKFKKSLAPYDDFGKSEDINREKSKCDIQLLNSLRNICGSGNIDNESNNNYDDDDYRNTKLEKFQSGKMSCLNRHSRILSKLNCSSKQSDEQPRNHNEEHRISKVSAKRHTAEDLEQQRLNYCHISPRNDSESNPDQFCRAMSIEPSQKNLSQSTFLNETQKVGENLTIKLNFKSKDSKNSDDRSMSQKSATNSSCLKLPNAVDSSLYFSCKILKKIILFSI